MHRYKMINKYQTTTTQGEKVMMMKNLKMMLKFQMEVQQIKCDLKTLPNWGPKP
jgi:hypothetical protein